MINGPIEFQWALDASGCPVPIKQARRGVAYVCPQCRNPMIARMGDQLQHHFAHEALTGCTTEAVARAVIRRWITIQLRESMSACTPVEVTWHCRYCGQSHTANLLQNITHLIEGHTLDGHFVDVVLTDSSDEVLGTLLVQDEYVPATGTLRAFMVQVRFVLVFPASVLDLGLDFPAWLEQAQINNGPCSAWQQATYIVREPDVILATLRSAVSRHPGYFVGAVETINGLAEVVKIGEQVLWLSPARWREIVGGTLSRLSPEIQIVIQNWPQADGSTIGLYYVSVQKTHAIGIRRYGPGANPTPRLDERFRLRRTTALDIAYYLVTH